MPTLPFLINLLSIIAIGSILILDSGPIRGRGNLGITGIGQTSLQLRDMEDRVYPRPASLIHMQLYLFFSKLQRAWSQFLLFLRVVNRQLSIWLQF